jgi:hypothetical protein
MTGTPAWFSPEQIEGSELTSAEVFKDVTEGLPDFLPGLVVNTPGVGAAVGTATESVRSLLGTATSPSYRRKPWEQVAANIGKGPVYGALSGTLSAGINRAVNAIRGGKAAITNAAKGAVDDVVEGNVPLLQQGADYFEGLFSSPEFVSRELGAVDSELNVLAKESVLKSVTALKKLAEEGKAPEFTQMLERLTVKGKGKEALDVVDSIGREIGAVLDKSKTPVPVDDVFSSEGFRMLSKAADDPTIKEEVRGLYGRALDNHITQMARNVLSNAERANAKEFASKYKIPLTVVYQEEMIGKEVPLFVINKIKQNSEKLAVDLYKRDVSGLA